MKEKKKADSYTESIKKYQDKQYLPGYYVGGKIHPALKAKTKAGGYAMLIVGIFLLFFYVAQLLADFSVNNLGWIIPAAFALLLIIVGVKFIKTNPHK